jgi:hypothetical protein
VSRPVLTVGAPVPGRARSLADVPDPVFAAALVGPGVAVDPERGPLTAHAPVSGRLGTVRLTGLGVSGAVLAQNVTAWWPGSSGGGQADDLVPSGESDGHLAAVLVSMQPVAAGPEVWRYPAERGQKPLRTAG